MKIKIVAIFSMLLIVVVCLKANAQTTKEVAKKEKATSTSQKFLESIGKPKNWVNDYEKVFSNSQIATLDSLVSYFESETGIEIAMLTVDTLMVPKTEFEDFSLVIGNVWGVGKKEDNNGIIVCFSRGSRKIRIGNGLGIERLISDRETKEVINKYFIPYFKKDDYYMGTFTGVTELIKLLRTKIKK